MRELKPVGVAGVRETVHNDLRLTGVEGLAHPVAELVVGDGAPEPSMGRENVMVQLCSLREASIVKIKSNPLTYYKCS